MADYSEKWGTDVDTAVQLALDDLKLTIDEVDISVLEEPSRGFFGIGSKLALVRVEKKKELKEKEAALRPEAEKKPEKKHTPKSSVPKKENAKKFKEPKETYEKESEKDYIKKEFFDINVDNLDPCEEHEALDFLRKVTKEMGLDLQITAKGCEGLLYIDIQGKDSGTIIGKRGQTLDAIQYLTSLVVNKGREDFTRIVVDAENYRSRREKTLEDLANRLAGKVIKTKRSVRLEPMNPYERKVIHETLQNHPKVTTRSEGQEPYRRIVIELK